MKIYIHAADDAEKVDSGTTFYKMTRKQFEDAFEKENLWIQEIIKRSKDFDCLVDMFGSEEIDGDYYICVTDGREIEVNGEMVDPETALQEYSLSDLSGYIKDATKKVILDSIGVPENFKDPDVKKWVVDMLYDGIDFYRLAEDYMEYWEDMR